MEWTPGGLPRLGANEKWRQARNLHQFRIYSKNHGVDFAQRWWTEGYRKQLADPAYKRDLPITDDERVVVHGPPTDVHVLGSRGECKACERSLKKILEEVA